MPPFPAWERRHRRPPTQAGHPMSSSRARHLHKPRNQLEPADHVSLRFAGQRGWSRRQAMGTGRRGRGADDDRAHFVTSHGTARDAKRCSVPGRRTCDVLLRPPGERGDQRYGGEAAGSGGLLSCRCLSSLVDWGRSGMPPDRPGHVGRGLVRRSLRASGQPTVGEWLLVAARPGTRLIGRPARR